MKEKKKITHSNADLLKQIQIQTELLQNVEKEIYENINQMLYLVRIKLAIIDLKQQEETIACMEQSGILIGQVIMDLRNLAKQVRL